MCHSFPKQQISYFSQFDIWVKRLLGPDLQPSSPLCVFIKITCAYPLSGHTSAVRDSSKTLEREREKKKKQMTEDTLACVVCFERFGNIPAKQVIGSASFILYLSLIFSFFLNLSFCLFPWNSVSAKLLDRLVLCKITSSFHKKPGLASSCGDRDGLKCDRPQKHDDWDPQFLKMSVVRYAYAQHHANNGPPSQCAAKFLKTGS